VIGYYIADFFCPLKKLIVELDGDTHDFDSDCKRDARLREKGYRTVRFSNLDVMGNMDGVLTDLLPILEETPDRWVGRGASTTPNPSSEEEGLK